MLVVLSLCPGLSTTTNCLGVHLPNTLYPTPIPILLQPCCGSRTSCPGHRDTSSGAKLSDYKLILWRKGTTFSQPGFLRWFTTRSEKPWSATGETEDPWLGTWTRGGWQLWSGLWIKDYDWDWVWQHWKLSSKQAKGHPAEGKPPFSWMLFLLGEPLRRLSNTSSGKETFDSLIAGSLCQTIAWRTRALGPGSW